MKINKLILGTIALLFLFSCKKTTTGSDEPLVVIFPDANFELVIRDAIGKPSGEILSTDLDSLEILEGSEKEITDI